MADYSAAASSIFDPQLQAEQTAAGSSRDTALQGLKEEQTTINPYYDQAEKTLSKTRASEGQQADFNYNEAGIYDSGLRQNSQNQLGAELIDQTKQLEDERATKLASIADRTNLVNNQYSSGISALVSKYQGLKNQWISDKQASDQAQAEAIREFNASQDLQRQSLAQNAAIQQAYLKMQQQSQAASAPTRGGYNVDLDGIESALKSYQGAGYKGDIGTRQATKNSLIQKYNGVISPKEISGYVDTLYNRYYVR